jgi:4-amino-4-deoxy-L-arabinose transferase-like glycosyltransferase
VGRRPDPRVLLGTIVVVGLVLRLLDASARINEDEGYSWLVATAPNAGAFLSRLARYENTPPLFYLLLAPLPHDKELWLRLPSIVAGVLSIPVLYALVRPLLGVRAALLAALGLAVAPFAVSYSDFSRGFMVAGFGVLVALLAAQRLAAGGTKKWWWAFVLGGVWALYAEYYAGLYLLAIIGALLVLGRPRRRDTAICGALPFLLFAPWIPELVRSLNELGKTKDSLVASGLSPGMIRDAIAPLFFGEHGAATSTALRSVQALALVAALGWASVRLRKTASRDAFWLLAGVMTAVLLMYLAATMLDTDIFRQRYMTTVIALAAAVLAGAVASLRWRPAVPAAGVVLAALGIAIGIKRAGREYEPNTAAAVAVARAHGYRTIATNSPEVAFYGRDLQIVLDRPFGIGAGVERACAPACAVIDDARFGGVRPGPGPVTAVGPIVVRFPPRER